MANKITIRAVLPLRSLIVQTVFSFYLIVLLWRLYSYNLPHQLANPPLLKTGIDPNSWIYLYFNLQHWLVENEIVSYIFSASILLTCLLVIIKPNKVLYIIVFTLIYYLYVIMFNINLSFHAHYMNAMMLLPFCFWVKKKFDITWEFARYYTCWIYSSAFIWKFINGAIFQPEQGFEIMKSELSRFIYLNPDSILTNIYTFFIEHSFLISIGTKAIYTLEGLFIIGFFTKKIDRYLIFSLLSIHIIIYFFVDTLFIEQCVLAFTLLSVKTWQNLSLFVKKVTFLKRSFKFRI